MTRATKFIADDRVVVVPNPSDPSDRRYANLSGVVEKYSHNNGDGDIYHVSIDGEGMAYLYEVDIKFEGEDLTLERQKARLEAELEEVKKAIREKEFDATEMPVGTVVVVKDHRGEPEVVTKQAEDSWIGIFLKGEGAVSGRTDAFDDKEMSVIMKSPSQSPRIHKPR